MDLLISQLLDPFRIGLIFFLIVTAIRTRAASGFVVPLALGVVFVAILLPMTTASNATDDRTTAIATGVVANAIILGVLLLGWTLWNKARRQA
jgi:hypothetical protein